MNKSIILSFDVGIKHLSYCLLTKNSDNNWNIIEWNNINLVENLDKFCHCGLKASYTNIINNIEYNYCKHHSKNITQEKAPFENMFKPCANTSDICKHKKKCEKICKYQLINTLLERSENTLLEQSENTLLERSENTLLEQSDNTLLGYCKIHANQYYNNIIKLQDLKSLKKNKTSTLNHDYIKYNLILELEKRRNLLLADYVVIENQPAFKNPQMKSIASTIYDYYMIRGIIDKDITKSNIKSVNFISPSNKLKLINDNDSKSLIIVKDNVSKTYKLTKQLGIKYCLELIQHLPSWINYFKDHKKKDDLADSFLQGVYFYTNSKLYK